MDISCIISSGDLELYVLGMLSQEENYKIAQLAELFPEIQNEIDEIQQSLLQLSDDISNTPSSSVRSSLFDQLHTLKQQETGTSEHADTTVENIANITTGKEETKIVPLRRSGSSNLMIAASLTALVVSIAAIAYLASKNSSYYNEVNQLQAQVNTIQQNAAAQQQQLTAYQRSLQMYQSPDYLKINLTSVPGKPDALVQLFWNKSTHDVYVADISLPQAPTGKQYQLWAIVNGKPISAGMMSDAKKTPQQMINFVKADAFAITLEKAGGNETPQGEIYVLGKTS